MEGITIVAGVVPRTEQMEALFKQTAWSDLRLEQLHKIKRALRQSMDVITAWKGTELVGLLRCVGDSYTVLYVPDITVKAAYRRQGIGKGMLTYLLSRYPTIQNRVVLAGNSKDFDAFYQACGLTRAENLGENAYLPKE